MGAIIREITAQDLAPIAVVHQAAFPESALTGLGRRAIKRYYHWLLTGPHPLIIAQAAEVNGNLTGFIFAGKFQGATTGFVSRNRFFLAFCVLTHLGLLRKPIFRHRLRTGLILLGHKLFKKTLPSPNVADNLELAKVIALPYCSILAIAVDPNQQRTGSGWMLMQHAEKVAWEKNYPQTLLTVHENNGPATQFYQRHGYRMLQKDGENLVLVKNLEIEYR
jgi:ribosomal protein S18 acetylase RimI-like enzyme